MRKIIALAVAVATSVAQAVPASAYDGPVFRWRTALGTSGANPDVVPGPVPGAEDPLLGPTTHLRVVVDSFGGATGALSELAFSVGGARIAPVSASVAGNAGSDAGAAFDGDAGTAWRGAEAVQTATFTYEVPAGTKADHLEIQAADGAAPTSFRILRSPNAVSWIPVIAYERETGWSQGERRRYPFSLAPTAPGGAGAHKFWRLAVERSNPDAYVWLREITFRDAAGRDVTTGGIGRTEGHKVYNRVDNLFDKTSAYYLADNDSLPYTASYEFPQPTEVASVDVQTGVPGGTPQVFRIESSDDGRTWTTHSKYRGQAEWESAELRNFPVAGYPRGPGEHQFWRVAVLASNSPTARGLHGLDFTTPDGKSQNAKTVPISSSVDNQSNGLAFIRQGGEYNPWRAAASDPSPWVGYVFPKPIKADTARIRAIDWGSPRAFAIEWSDDGDTWVRSSTHRGNGGWTFDAWRSFPVVDTRTYPADARRHWRVVVESAQAEIATARVDELQFLASDGSPLAATGVPSANGVSRSTTAWNAFDGLVGEYRAAWESAALPGILSYEFPEPMSVSGIRMAAWTTRGPNSFRVESSPDGVTWTTAASFNGNGNWKGDTRDFMFAKRPGAAGEHQFWRLLVSAADRNTRVVLPELDFVGPDGVDRQTQGAHGPVSGTAAAFDNAANTSYTSGTIATVGSVAVGYAFPVPVPVSEIRITGAATGTPQDFAIQWSDDGNAWTTAETYSNAGFWTAGETRVFPIPKPKAAPGEGYGYALNVRRIVPAGYTGTVGMMTVDGVALLGTDGGPLATRGVSSVYMDTADRTIDNAFDASTSTVYRAKGGEVRIDIGHATPVLVRDVRATVKAGCTCDVEFILYRFPDTETRDTVLTRTLSGY